MTNIQIIYLIVIFAAVFAAAFAGLHLLTPSGARQRVRELGVGQSPIESKSKGWVELIADISKPFAKLSVPEEGWEDSPLRTRFMNAGLRTPSLPIAFF